MENTVSDVRKVFVQKFKDNEFVTDKTGVKTIEIINASFVADEVAIFGTPNQEYINREIQWYESQSLSVNDLVPTPAIWKMISSDVGNIHSNYGHLVHSAYNHHQYKRVREQLSLDQNSRRAVMIYTRPTMHLEYNLNGMSDFICTNTVQYLIRNEELHAVVQMRSNDVVFGYRNDYAWQAHVLQQLAKDLKIGTGKIHWNVGSLHVYERHFKYIDDESKKENRVDDQQFDRYASANRDWSHQVSKFYD
jgi:thymidylate synthase